MDDWCPRPIEGSRPAYGPSLFSTGEPTLGSPHLWLRNLDPVSKTWKSAHEGAAALVCGAFMDVRNLVSHSGGPAPDSYEVLEMLAVLSYVAHLGTRHRSTVPNACPTLPWASGSCQLIPSSRSIKQAMQVRPPEAEPRCDPEAWIERSHVKRPAWTST